MLGQHVANVPWGQLATVLHSSTQHLPPSGQSLDPKSADMSPS